MTELPPAALQVDPQGIQLNGNPTGGGESHLYIKPNFNLLGQQFGQAAPPKEPQNVQVSYGNGKATAAEQLQACSFVHTSHSHFGHPPFAKQHTRACTSNTALQDCKRCAAEGQVLSEADEVREQHREDRNTYGACVAVQGYTNYALDPKKGTYSQVPNQAPPFMGVNPAGNPTPQYTSYAAQAPASYGAADSAASQTAVWQQVTAVNNVTRSQSATHFAKDVAWPLFWERR